jgi:peptidyl-prolyl cis-trans isomerase C
MPRRFLFALLASAALACQGSSSHSPAESASPSGEAPTSERGRIVASWAGDALTVEDVRAEMERTPAPSRVFLEAPQRKRDFVDRMITNRLLFDEGRRLGYADDPAIVRQLDALRERLVIQRVMRDYRARPEISDEEARRWYEENRSSYSTTRVRASHILLADEETATAVRNEVLENPTGFPEIARDRSEDKMSAKRGGDLGTFGVGRMVPEFERAAFALEPGEISQPVKTRYGWHLIKITERDEGEIRPFETVKPQIKSLLANRRVEEQVKAKLDALRAAAEVRIDEEALAAIEPPPGGPPVNPHGGMAAGH